MSVIEVLDHLSDLCGEAMPKGVHKINCAGFGIYIYVPEVQVVTNNYGGTWSFCLAAVN